MIQAAFHGYPVGYFTPTYKLLEGTYKDCLTRLEPMIKKKHDNQFIELVTGGVIEFWSMDNPNAGRSRKYKLAIIDEAAFVKNLWDCWTQSIRATLTDLKGDAWFMSTPRGKNDFFKLFMRGKSGDANWMSWQMSTYANPYIDPNELDDAKADLPEAAFNQEYLAEFNENIANPFGSDNIKKNIMPLSPSYPVVFGIDLAKSFDYTVIIGLDHLGSVCVFDRFQGDWGTTMQKIRSLPKLPLIIDSTGVGDPIAEQITRDGYNVTAFKFTSTSKQDLMKGLQSAIHRGAISYPEGIITDELSVFEYEYSPNGVKYSAPTGFHDDCVMALALAWRGFDHNRGSNLYSFS